MRVGASVMGHVVGWGQLKIVKPTNYSLVRVGSYT